MSAWPSAHKPQPCPHCGRVYKTLQGMLNHLRTHKKTAP